MPSAEIIFRRPKLDIAGAEIERPSLRKIFVEPAFRWKRGYPRFPGSSLASRAAASRSGARRAPRRRRRSSTVATSCGWMSLERERHHAAALLRRRARARGRPGTSRSRSMRVARPARGRARTPRPCRAPRGSRPRRRRPTASAIAMVPASNFHGSSFHFELGRASPRGSSRRRPGTAASPRAARAAPTARRCRSARASCAPVNATKSQPSACTSTGMCGTLCEASTSTSAPAACAGARDLRDRVHGAEHVRDVHHADQLHAAVGEQAGQRRPGPARRAPVTGMKRSSMPRSAARICHGTRFEWCSISVSRIASPALQRRARPTRRPPG